MSDSVVTASQSCIVFIKFEDVFLQFFCYNTIMLSKEDFRSIEDVICDFINKDNVKFVFPSAIAMETWSDWAIKNSSKTGYCAIALENWTEWDTFKRNLHKFTILKKTVFRKL